MSNYEFSFSGGFFKTWLVYWLSSSASLYIKEVFYWGIKLDLGFKQHSFGFVYMNTN